MFSNLAISLLVGVGFGGWVYSKLQHQTGGGNAQNSLIGAALSGVVAASIVFIILGYIFK